MLATTDLWRHFASVYKFESSRPNFYIFPSAAVCASSPMKNIRHRSRL